MLHLSGGANDAIDALEMARSLPERARAEYAALIDPVVTSQHDVDPGKIRRAAKEIVESEKLASVKVPSLEQLVEERKQGISRVKLIEEGLVNILSGKSETLIPDEYRRAAAESLRAIDWRTLMGEEPYWEKAVELIEEAEIEIEEGYDPKLTEFLEEVDARLVNRLSRAVHILAEFDPEKYKDDIRVTKAGVTKILPSLYRKLACDVTVDDLGKVVDFENARRASTLRNLVFMGVNRAVYDDPTKNPAVYDEPKLIEGIEVMLSETSGDRPVKRFHGDKPFAPAMVWEVYGARLGETTSRGVIGESCDEESEQVPEVGKENLMTFEDALYPYQPGDESGEYDVLVKLSKAAIKPLVNPDLVGGGEGRGKRYDWQRILGGLWDIKTGQILEAHQVTDKRNIGNKNKASMAALLAARSYERVFLDVDSLFTHPEDAFVQREVDIMYEQGREEMDDCDRRYPLGNHVARRFAENLPREVRPTYKWEGYRLATDEHQTVSNIPDLSDWDEGRPRHDDVIINEYGEGPLYVAYSRNRFQQRLEDSGNEGIAELPLMRSNQIVIGLPGVKEEMLQRAVECGYVNPHKMMSNKNPVKAFSEEHIAPLTWWQDTGFGAKVGGNVKETMLRLATQDFEEGIKIYNGYLAAQEELLEE